MTSKELMAKYRSCGEQELPVFLHFLADHWHALRLADGQALNDYMDSAAALRELAECARIPEHTENRTYRCSDCDHEHEGKTECSKYLGEGKFCRCESKVMA